MTKPIDHYCAHPEDDKRWPLWGTWLFAIVVNVVAWGAVAAGVVALIGVFGP